MVVSPNSASSTLSQVVIEKMRREGATGLIVVPIWKNRLYRHATII